MPTLRLVAQRLDATVVLPLLRLFTAIGHAAWSTRAESLLVVALLGAWVLATHAVHVLALAYLPGSAPRGVAACGRAASGVRRRLEDAEAARTHRAVCAGPR